MKWSRGVVCVASVLGLAALLQCAWAQDSGEPSVIGGAGSIDADTQSLVENGSLADLVSYLTWEVYEDDAAALLAIGNKIAERAGGLTEVELEQSKNVLERALRDIWVLRQNWSDNWRFGDMATRTRFFQGIDGVAAEISRLVDGDKSDPEVVPDATSPLAPEGQGKAGVSGDMRPADLRKEAAEQRVHSVDKNYDMEGQVLDPATLVPEMKGYIARLYTLLEGEDYVGYAEAKYGPWARYVGKSDEELDQALQRVAKVAQRSRSKYLAGLQFPPDDKQSDWHTWCWELSPGNYRVWAFCVEKQTYRHAVYHFHRLEGAWSLRMVQVYLKGGGADQDW